MDRKVSSKIMDKASNNLVVNNQVSKVSRLAIVRMEITSNRKFSHTPNKFKKKKVKPP
jgi:hypothetical protein